MLNDARLILDALGDDVDVESDTEEGIEAGFNWDGTGLDGSFLDMDDAKPVNLRHSLGPESSSPERRSPPSIEARRSPPTTQSRWARLNQSRSSKAKTLVTFTAMFDKQRRASAARAAEAAAAVATAEAAAAKAASSKPGLPRQRSRRLSLSGATLMDTSACEGLLSLPHHRRSEENLTSLASAHEHLRFFASLGDPALVREVCRYMTYMRLPAGRMVFDMGDEADAFYIIRSGAVRISRVNKETGEDFLTLATLGEGDSFGARALAARHAPALVTLHTLSLRTHHSPLTTHHSPLPIHA